MITPLKEKLLISAAKRSTASDIEQAEILGAADAVNLIGIWEPKILIRERDFKFGEPNE